MLLCVLFGVRHTISRAKVAQKFRTAEYLLTDNVEKYVRLSECPMAKVVGYEKKRADARFFGVVKLLSILSVLKSFIFQRSGLTSFSAAVNL